MSESKHTPGPWKATYDSQLRAAIEIYSTEDRIMVAVLPDRGTIEAMPEIEANANLIADAWQLPDLRREIEELKAINKDMYEALECVCDRYCIGYAGDSLVKCEDCTIRKALRKARGAEE